jgi:hypothetical protein
MIEKERQRLAYEAHLRLIEELYARGWRKLAEHKHPCKPQALVND